jgi:hypothetical protein
MVSQPEGASEVLYLEDFSPLTEIATQHPLVLNIFGYTWMNASNSSAEVAAVQANVDKIIPALLIAFRQTDAVTLIECLGNFLPKVVPEVSHHTLFTDFDTISNSP